MTTFGSIISTEEKTKFYRQLNTPLNFGKFKGQSTTLLNIPLQYIKWLYENSKYLEYLVPEIKIFIIHKLDPLFNKDKLEKDDFCIMVPNCKCGIQAKSIHSRKNNRDCWSCSKQVLNKFNGKYEGGCDFFKWGFPSNSTPRDEMVYYL